MMARSTSADVNVVALVGERGREVNEFIQRDLGAGLAKSVVVVATSDEPALARVQAAQAATAVAEYFRDQGKDVLLLVDSLTRLALARAKSGWPLASRRPRVGFRLRSSRCFPSYSKGQGGEHAAVSPDFIPCWSKAMIRANRLPTPYAACSTGIPGSAQTAARGHYPAIDVLESVSRLMMDLAGEQHRAAAQTVRHLLAEYREHEDWIFHRRLSHGH